MAAIYTGSSTGFMVESSSNMTTSSNSSLDWLDLTGTSVAANYTSPLLDNIYRQLKEQTTGYLAYTNRGWERPELTSAPIQYSSWAMYNTGYYTSVPVSTSPVNYIVWPLEDKGFTFKQKIKNNLVILTKSRADLPNVVDSAERVAMETLREMVSETEFRKYLKYGFVLVEGESGSVYQVFRNRSHTKVWKNGKVIEEICVRIKDNKVPPTDNVIAFRQIIKTSESEFRKLGNVYKMGKVA